MLKDTGFEELEALNEWELEHKEQDIRNRPLVTPTGENLGIIDDLLVDRSAERVAAVRLEDGRMCAVEALEIQADKVIYQPAGETVATAATAEVTDTDTVQLVEEQAVVGKTAVVGDTIRVKTRVLTDTVSEDITLVDEDVVVEAREVNQPIDPAKADALFEEKTISATEVHEEAVVGKRAVVTEEISLGKTADEHVETVTETVRKTVAEVEEIPGEATTTTATAKYDDDGNLLDAAGNAIERTGDAIARGAKDIVS